MVHVGLDELERLLLDHAHCLRIHQLLKLGYLLSGYAFAILRRFEGLFQNRLDVAHALSALPQAQAEVAEPLMVQSDGPVFA